MPQHQHELHPLCALANTAPAQFNYCNYTLFMPSLRLVKFGITGRLSARLQEIGKAAARLGETTMRWHASAALPGVARIVETVLRQELRSWAEPGRLEWVAGGELDFATICDRTEHLQTKIASTLGVDRA